MGLHPVPYFLLLCFCVATAIKPKSKSDDIAGFFNTYNNYNGPPISATAHNPWISGPDNKKYQFHVGEQSWLSAREICLAENADLVTIKSSEEIDWILSHYKPQSRIFRERQLQIGLSIDANADSTNLRNWKWVNGDSLNASLFKWPIGEPFDHAGGRERCAILNVNRRTLEDVDCDLSGNSQNFYRFVCERTNLHHLKHEELNNPLWKKLEDILVFFGISQSSSAGSNETLAADPVQLDEEDYMENVKLNSTENTKIEASGEEPKPTEQQKPTEWTADPDDADELLPKTTEELKPAKTLSDGPPFPSSSSAAAHGTKLAEPTIQNDADLLANKELEKLDGNEANESINDATTDPTLQRTTKSDPLEKLAETLEHEMSKEGQASIGDRMHQLERIINAVQTMLEEPDDKDEKANSTKATPPTTTELPLKEPTTEGLEIVQLIEKQNKELIDQNVVDAGELHEEVQTALNLEGDFEHAAVESLKHPNTNSGDFLLLGKQEELVGCGAKNLGGTRPPPSTTTASIVNKTEQVDKLLDSLRGLLSGSSSDVLNDLLASGGDPKSVVEKLQKVAQEAPTSSTTRSPVEVQKMRKRVEYEILKSLEDLREVESKEFVEMKSNSQELVAIGSGLEPPTERLIHLTPTVLTAHQVRTTESTESSTKKSTETDGFDTTLMLHLPKKDELKKDESTQRTIPESEEDEESDVVKSLRAKFQQKLEKSAPSVFEGSGLSLSSSEEDDKSMEQLNAEFDSVFPKPDFGLLKNKKLEAQSKKNLALEKQRVDKAYEQFNSSFNSQSLMERIRQSETERTKSANGTIETKADSNATETSTLSPHDEQLAKTLEEIFNDWMELLGRR